MSLLIRGATAVTSLAPPVVARLDIHVDGGRVVALAPSLEIGGPHIDATGCVVIPGNVNAHMHAYSALARGMPYRLAPPANFREILERVWWRLDRALDADSIRASALVAAREALLAGTTTLIDHHASPNAIDGSLESVARAFDAVGVRSALCYEVSDRDGEERAAAGVQENERFVNHVSGGAFPLARAMVGAHASFTMSDRTLADCAALARDAGVGLHIHVAEDAIDEGAARRLAAAGALDERTLAAHAVHVTTDEAALLAERGVTVAHNPRSNMHNGVGRTPLGLFNGRVALGTDGIGSDMFEEARAGYFRRREEDLSVGAGWALDRLAAGGKLAGRIFDEPLLGTIAVGAPADLVVLDYEPPTALDTASLGGHWIYGMASARVRDVLVGGEAVVRDRRLTRFDEDALAATAREMSQRLWRRMEAL
jgi:putative selenium metabolism protein SsnA